MSFMVMFPRNLSCVYVFPLFSEEIGNVCMQATLKETETEMCKLLSSG